MTIESSLLRITPPGQLQPILSETNPALTTHSYTFINDPNVLDIKEQTVFAYSTPKALDLTTNILVKPGSEVTVREGSATRSDQPIGGLELYMLSKGHVDVTFVSGGYRFDLSGLNLNNSPET